MDSAAVVLIALIIASVLLATWGFRLDRELRDLEDAIPDFDDLP